MRVDGLEQRVSFLNMEINDLWKTALSEIELTVGRASFITWFKDTTIIDASNGKVMVSVPNGFAKEWLQNKYNKYILSAIRNLNPEIREINYLIGKPQIASVRTDRPIQIKKRPMDVSEDSSLSSEFELKDLNINPETNLNPKYTFDSFVVGSFNELAHAAAQSVVKRSGHVYNPLFIYGGVGLGKTHLIQSIGNEFIKQNPKVKIRYVSSEKFMSEIVEALKNQEMNKLKEKYRTCDMLIMDDVQFIARTEKMQEEFFHTFNALYESNKQIIISSDRPPAAIATLEDRLKSRFEGGMIADIGEPDYETKLTILKVKTEKKGVSLPDEVLEHIAHTIKSNIRELEGALNRIILTSKMSNLPPTIEAVKKTLNQVIYAPRKFTTPKKIIKAVADFYEISEKEILNRSRKKGVVKPRQIAMYLLRDELKCSFPFIGEKLGRKDHTTAIHAYKKITEEVKINLNLDEELKLIKEKVYNT